MKKVVFLFLGILSLTLGCTRDDICTDQTDKTPLLIIRFYNAQNPEAFKAVTNFTIVPQGDTIALFQPQTTDSLAIPLDTRFDITDYILYINATDDVPGADLMSFSYERENEFINRACAFRTNFKNLDINLAPSNQQSWIDDFLIRSDSINARNQNEAHLYIYH